MFCAVAAAASSLTPCARGAHYQRAAILPHPCTADTPVKVSSASTKGHPTTFFVAALFFHLREFSLALPVQPLALALFVRFFYPRLTPLPLHGSSRNTLLCTLLPPPPSTTSSSSSSSRDLRIFLLDTKTRGSEISPRGDFRPTERERDQIERFRGTTTHESE